MMLPLKKCKLVAKVENLILGCKIHKLPYTDQNVLVKFSSGKTRKLDLLLTLIYWFLNQLRFQAHTWFLFFLKCIYDH